MAAIKIENADVHSSIPLVFDVKSPTEKEPIATHRLTFGDFVIVDSLENLHMVTVEEWQARQAEEAAAAAREEKKDAVAAAAEVHAEPPKAGKSDKMTRGELEAMTKDELQDLADDWDIDVNSHDTKADMVDAIMKGQ